MNAAPIYTGVGIVILAVIAVIVFVIRKEKPGRRLTPLAGYGLLGIGLILAIIDMVLKSRKA